MPEQAGRIIRLPHNQHARTKPRRRARRVIPEDYLHAYRNERGVRWVAVDLAAIDEILAAALLAGIEFSDRLALVDLHVAVTRDDLRPFRWYAARWRWSERRARTLFEREGLLEKPPSQKRHEGVTGNADSKKKKKKVVTEASRRRHGILLEREKQERESPDSPAPGAGDPEQKEPTPKKRRSAADESDVAAELAERIIYPDTLDTPDVRAEFAKWILFRMFTLPRAKTGAKIAGDPLEFFQTQIDHATRSGKFYIPGGSAGYVAALVESREQQWRHPYPDRDFNGQSSPTQQPIQRLI